MSAAYESKAGPKFATPPGRVHDVIAQLRDERRRRGWSQRKLADKAGCNCNTVIMIENGRVQSPRLIVISDMAQALGFELTLHKCAS